MKNINEKTVFITGAASGIGKALSIEFAKEGSKLILLDINKKDLFVLKKKLKKDYNAVVETIICNLTNKKDIDCISKKFLKKTDILINNAGAGSKGFFIDWEFDEFEFIVKLNYLSVVQLTHRFIKETDLTEEKYVVNVSSPAGFVDVPFMSAYSSSKRAVTSFSKCLSLEMFDKNLKVMLAVPAPLRNTNFGKGYGNQIKHGWFYNHFFTYTPQYVANKIIKGIIKGKRYVYAPFFMGSIFYISNLFPGLKDYFSRNSLKKISKKLK